ncbi:Nitrogen fixation protein of unknown function [Synechococcus sp. MIT S9508]|uniref:Nif11-like leader peptide family natural product precursor n=1 Tax=Synechococcus sp. MIT S9508 TaxID=1801629 RepID=UPI0007BBF3AC|nr:Nitrogen fixation protein of unknown function [Synechococcus sp. MIT S9508]
MSLEQLKAFLAKVKGDSSLQEKLKAAKSQDDVVSIAKDHGHEFTSSFAVVLDSCDGYWLSFQKNFS